MLLALPHITYHTIDIPTKGTTPIKEPTLDTSVSPQIRNLLKGSLSMLYILWVWTK